MTYLTTEEYTRLRHVQDESLKREFGSLHQTIDSLYQTIDGVKGELREFKEDVREFKEDVRRQFSHQGYQLGMLTDQLGYLTAQIRQSTAVFRNSRINTPLSPIHPIVVYFPDRGLVEPDQTLYPRNPNEFFGLKNPRTARQQKMLLYLIDLYDDDVKNRLSLVTSDQSSDDSETGSESQSFPYDPVEAVKILTVILGLDEDRINAVREAAKQRSVSPPSKPAKRSNPFPQSRSERTTRRLKIAPHSPPPGQLDPWTVQTSPKTTTTSNGLDQTRLEWRTRSTPSSQRVTVNGLKRAKKAEEPSSQPPADDDEQPPSQPGGPPSPPRAPDQAAPGDDEPRPSPPHAPDQAAPGDDEARPSSPSAPNQTVPSDDGSPTIPYSTPQRTSIQTT